LLWAWYFYGFVVFAVWPRISVKLNRALNRIGAKRTKRPEFLRKTCEILEKTVCFRRYSLSVAKAERFERGRLAIAGDADYFL